MMERMDVQVYRMFCAVYGLKKEIMNVQVNCAVCAAMRERMNE
jgi:hypothetical protein